MRYGGSSISLIPGIDNNLLYLAAGIGIIGVIIATVILIRSRAAERETILKIVPKSFHTSPQIKQTLQQFRKSTVTNVVAPARSPAQEDTDCFHDRASLHASLAALAKKYSLVEATLATADGLLLASSIEAPTAEEIARFCRNHTDPSNAQPEGIRIYDIEHKGSSLVMITKTTGSVTDGQEPALVQEAKDILKWWI